ncbi:c6 transcription factor [Fusarium sp. NRRL 52700]|nr:c6 transcription factor [Fusarium sp. NRRL 52700]
MTDLLSNPPKYALPHTISIQRRTQCFSTNDRRKKVLRACDRCRVRKTKCSGLQPCSRCQRDGFVCTAGNPRKSDFRQLSPEDTEVYKKTHSVFEATIKRLYLMVRNGETWDFDEPEKDNCGELIVHDIVHKLGYALPSTEAESPTSPMVSENEAKSEESASRDGDETEDEVLKEEAVVPDTGLLTPCQAEQLPYEQCDNSFTDDSNTYIDGCVGNGTLNTSPQHWANGLCTDLSQPIWGTDMMAMNWQQLDLISKACPGIALVNNVQMVQPLAGNMYVEDSQIGWF